MPFHSGMLQGFWGVGQRESYLEMPQGIMGLVLARRRRYSHARGPHGPKALWDWQVVGGLLSSTVPT